jgi:hypothetical protein
MRVAIIAFAQRRHCQGGQSKAADGRARKSLKNSRLVLMGRGEQTIFELLCKPKAQKGSI